MKTPVCFPFFAALGLMAACSPDTNPAAAKKPPGKPPQMPAEKSARLETQPPQPTPASPLPTASSILNANLNEDEKDRQLDDLARRCGEAGVQETMAFLLELPAGEKYRTIGYSALNSFGHDNTGKIPELAMAMQQSGSAWGKEAIRVLLLDCHSPEILLAMAKLPFPVEDRGLYVGTVLHRMEGELTAEARLKLVEQIPDEALRQQMKINGPYILAGFENNYDLAIQNWGSLPAEVRQGKEGVFATKLKSLPNADQIFTAIANSELSDKSTILVYGVGSWLRDDLNKGLDWMNSLPDGKLKDAILKSKWQIIAAQDADAAAQWIGKVSDPHSRKALLEACAQKYPPK